MGGVVDGEWLLRLMFGVRGKEFESCEDVVAFRLQNIHSDGYVGSRLCWDLARSIRAHLLQQSRPHMKRHVGCHRWLCSAVRVSCMVLYCKDKRYPAVYQGCQ